MFIVWIAILVNFYSCFSLQAVESVDSYLTSLFKMLELTDSDSLKEVQAQFYEKSSVSRDINEQAWKEAVDSLYTQSNNIINNIKDLKQKKATELDNFLIKQSSYFKALKRLAWGFIFIAPVIIGSIVGNKKFANDIEIHIENAKIQLKHSGIEESAKDYTQKLNTCLFYSRVKYTVREALITLLHTCKFFGVYYLYVF